MYVCVFAYAELVARLDQMQGFRGHSCHGIHVYIFLLPPITVTGRVCVCVVLIIMWGKRFFLNHFEGMTFIRVVQVLFPVDNLSESEIKVMYCHCDTAQILYLVLQFMKKIQ